MITEGYMFCCVSPRVTAKKVSDLASELKSKRPEFKFNTCLVSELNLGNSVLTVENITVVPYRMPKDHFWFVLVPEKGKLDES